MGKSRGTATVTKKSRYRDRDAWLIKFDPGLPYDRKTKGLPHTNVWCVEVEKQNCAGSSADAALTTLVFCEDDKGEPDLTYIHNVVEFHDMGELKDAVREMGYDLVDGAAQKKSALLKSALKKLTPAERAAVLARTTG